MSAPLQVTEWFRRCELQLMAARRAGHERKARVFASGLNAARAAFAQVGAGMSIAQLYACMTDAQAKEQAAIEREQDEQRRTRQLRDVQSRFAPPRATSA